MTYFVQHLLFSAFTVSIGLYFYVAANAMPDSARMFPQMMAVLIFLFSGLMVFNAWRVPEDGVKVKINVLRVTVFAAGVAVYIASTEALGYFISTPLFMVAGYLYLRAASLLKAALIALSFSVFVYLLFVRFLNLPVPMGLLESVLGA